MLIAIFLSGGGLQMSTLENTVAMMEVLPETDLIKIQNFTKELIKLYENEVDDKAGRFLAPMTENDFLHDIGISEEQYNKGEYQEMGEALDEICRELGI